MLCTCSTIIITAWLSFGIWLCISGAYNSCQWLLINTFSNCLLLHNRIGFCCYNHSVTDRFCFAILFANGDSWHFVVFFSVSFLFWRNTYYVMWHILFGILNRIDLFLNISKTLQLIKSNEQTGFVTREFN